MDPGWLMKTAPDLPKGARHQMLICQAIYGRDRGAQIVAFLESATGAPCPCKQGTVCPLLPADDLVQERQPAPSPLLNTA